MSKEDVGSILRYTLDIFGIMGGIASFCFWLAINQIKEKLDLKIERAGITIADRIRKIQDKNVMKIAVLDARVSQIEKLTSCEINSAFKVLESSIEDDYNTDLNNNKQ
jgi:hypothetical protein